MRHSPDKAPCACHLPRNRQCPYEPLYMVTWRASDAHLHPVVYRPGATAPKDNEYTDYAEAVSAAPPSIRRFVCASHLVQVINESLDDAQATQGVTVHMLAEDRHG